MATLNIVNDQNETVGTLDVRDDAFGRKVKPQLIWESVVHANAAERRGTHATKTRARVSGSGRKPWRQKGTGRARVGEIRNPLWRKGGTVFGPQPRSYDYRLPRKVERGGLRAALGQRLQEGAIVVVDRLAAEEIKTKPAVELLERLGASGKALLIDVRPDDNLILSVRNIPGVNFLSTGMVTARDVMNTQRVIVTPAALQHLQDALAGAARAERSSPVVEEEKGASLSEPEPGTSAGRGRKSKGPASRSAQKTATRTPRKRRAPKSRSK